MPSSIVFKKTLYFCIQEYILYCVVSQEDSEKRGRILGVVVVMSLMIWLMSLVNESYESCLMSLMNESYESSLL